MRFPDFEEGTATATVLHEARGSEVAWLRDLAREEGHDIVVN